MTACHCPAFTVLGVSARGHLLASQPFILFISSPDICSTFRTTVTLLGSETDVRQSLQPEGSELQKAEASLAKNQLESASGDREATKLHSWTVTERPKGLRQIIEVP